MDCVFCKIVSGDLPSHKVYEDENTLAFLDIAPVNPGHILVIPKKHSTNFEDTTEENLASTIVAVKKVGYALKHGLGIEGYNVQVNNDPIAGQIIPHLHFHVIPRSGGDGLNLWPQGRYEVGQAESYASQISKAID